MYRVRVTAYAIRRRRYNQLPQQHDTRPQLQTVRVMAYAIAVARTVRHRIRASSALLWPGKARTSPWELCTRDGPRRSRYVRTNPSVQTIALAVSTTTRGRLPDTHTHPWPTRNT